MAGDADPHYVQTWTHTHLRGARRTAEEWTAANVHSVNGTSSCSAGWGAGQVDYCHARSSDYELQRVVSALAGGSYPWEDKTNNTILSGDVRCSRSTISVAVGTYSSKRLERTTSAKYEGKIGQSISSQVTAPKLRQHSGSSCSIAAQLCSSLGQESCTASAEAAYSKHAHRQQQCLHPRGTRAAQPALLEQEGSLSL
eukprot:1182818-Rhodomonas_salina.2